MVWFLRLLFFGVLGSMLAVTSWASLQCPLFSIPREVAQHPWFIATLFDAYWGFVTFYVWLFWKEKGGVARSLWFLAVMALGNIAMSAYVLRELFTVDAADDLRLVFTRRNPGTVALPGALVAAAIGIAFVA